MITVGHRDGSTPPAQEWVRRRAGYRSRTIRPARCPPRSTAIGLPQLLRAFLLLRAVYARQRGMVKPEDMVCLQRVTKAFPEKRVGNRG